MTWRAPADLIDGSAVPPVEHRSMNDYVTAVLDAATNPRLAGSQAERLRERLDQAGCWPSPVNVAGVPRARRPLAPVGAPAQGRRYHSWSAKTVEYVRRLLGAGEALCG